MRGRGLKLYLRLGCQKQREVALRARAWIETAYAKNTDRWFYVALRARAWIETLYGEGGEFTKTVALRARAWIETPSKLTRA